MGNSLYQEVFRKRWRLRGEYSDNSTLIYLSFSEK
jgi:hypothetical protein